MKGSTKVLQKIFIGVTIVTIGLAVMAGLNGGGESSPQKSTKTTTTNNSYY